MSKLILPIIALLGTAMPAKAAVSVSHFELPRSEGRGGAAVDWQMREENEILLTVSYCPYCRNPAPRRYRFQIDSTMAQRIDALVPDPVIEAATQAPCTLPYGEAGWTRRVDITKTLENRSVTHRAFFLSCQSAELDALRARLAQVAQLLLEEVRRRELAPEG